MTNKKIQSFIYAFFERVEGLFREYVDNNEVLCGLRELDFQNQHFPNYNNQEIQCLYLMRYFYAYFTEYYCLYQDFLGRLDTQPHIVSIGCGNGVDGAALYFANEGNPFKYTGFDAVNWNPRATDLLTGDFHYYQTNIRDAILPQNNNVLIFPKSLTDFDGGDFTTFVANLTSEAFENKVLVLSSVMAEGTNYDVERMGLVIEKLRQLGFNLISGDVGTTLRFKEQGACCKLIQAGFPDDVKFLMKELKQHCQGGLDSCDMCGIDRLPILKNDRARFQMLLLERE